jgi:lysylphosphatidylglycerol synthetase-like protein (DUF2156 family)
MSALPLRARFLAGYALGVAAFVAMLLYLDGRGVFFYLTYLPALTAGTVLAAFTYRFLTRGPHARRDVAWWAALSLAMLIAIIACTHAPTSERKRFYLAATSLSGLTRGEVQQKLQPFKAKIFFASPQEMSFGYPSQPGTTDVVIVKFTRGRATASEFSPD